MKFYEHYIQVKNGRPKVSASCPACEVGIPKKFVTYVSTILFEWVSSPRSSGAVEVQTPVTMPITASSPGGADIAMWLRSLQ